MHPLSGRRTGTRLTSPHLRVLYWQTLLKRCWTGSLGRPDQRVRKAHRALPGPMGPTVLKGHKGYKGYKESLATLEHRVPRGRKVTSVLKALLVLPTTTISPTSRRSVRLPRRMLAQQRGQSQQVTMHA